MGFRFLGRSLWVGASDQAQVTAPRQLASIIIACHTGLSVTPLADPTLVHFSHHFSSMLASCLPVSVFEK